MLTPEVHYVAWRSLGQEFLFHEIHVGCDVSEELTVTLAQIIKVRLTRSRVGETVAGTLAVAGKEPFAFAALVGEPALLDAGKVLLLRGIHQLEDGLLTDVA